MRIAIETMSCGSCARSVTKAIQAADPAAKVTAHVERREVEVSTSRSQAEILTALDEAGYPGLPIAA